ncbi:hypothetical protein LTR92_005018 [Exophiala xenobiotica]|nr:hypothetical protein LTR92_005018 [Exophiala xenobiotica]KAK5392298.1 hypothetical protein LTR79_010270 [Exophiala xenobiotica]
MHTSPSGPLHAYQGGETDGVSTRTSLSQYPKLKISQLKSGPVQACITGIVANLQNHSPADLTTPNGARGCVKMILKDETGEILVSLWFLDTRFNVILNHIVTIWTTYCSSTSNISPQTNSKALTAPLCTSLFPERNVGCGLRIFRNDSQLLSPADSDLRSRVARSLDCWDAITSLESFIGGDGSIENVQILVCVTGIGDCVTGSKSPAKTSHQFPAIPVFVVDQSRPLSPIRLIFENPLHESVPQLRPHHTVLFVTDPRLVGTQLLVLSHTSRVLVDPDTVAANTLRRYLGQLSPPCNMTPEENGHFEGSEELDELFAGPPQLTSLLGVWTLMSKDQGNPCQAAVPVIITSLSLALLFRHEALFCMTCPSCFAARYSNEAEYWCDCDEDAGMDMRLNPQFLCGFSDETTGYLRFPSSTAEGLNSQDGHHATNLTWPLLGDTESMFLTDKACTALLGMTPIEIESLGILQSSHDCLATLTTIEEKLLWSRIILLIGWTGSGGLQIGDQQEGITVSHAGGNQGPNKGRMVILDAAHI